MSKLPKMKLLLVREGRGVYLEGKPLSDPSAVARHCKDLLNEPSENLLLVALNGKNVPLARITLSVGGLNFAAAHPREVFRAALMANAASIILVHNHPSGDPTPSRNDVALTQELKKAGRILGIDVLDHVVVAAGGHRSIREDGGLS